AGIVREEQPRRDGQMSRRRDRKELRQPLHHREDDHLPPRHGRRIHATTVPVSRSEGRFGTAAADRPRVSHRVTNGGHEAALVGDVDVCETTRRDRDHVVVLGHGARQPRAVHLDDQVLTIGAESEATAVADLAKTVGVEACVHVLDHESQAGTIAVSGESHGVTIPRWTFLKRLDWPVIVWRKTLVCVLVVLGVVACSSKSDEAPPTVSPAGPASAPPVTTAPAGQVHPLAGKAQSAVFDSATSSLVVLSDVGLTVMPATGDAHAVALPSAATALA